MDSSLRLDLREKILNLSYAEWKKLGFSKATLHYIKLNAKVNKPFTPNKHVLERLGGFDSINIFHFRAQSGASGQLDEILRRWYKLAPPYLCADR